MKEIEEDSLGDAPWPPDRRGFCAVALDDAKSGCNLGGAIRAARCYGAAFVVATGRIARVDHPAAIKGYLHLPVLRMDDPMDAMPAECESVAVDIVPGARMLPEFTHPERAYYVFGGEDRTLSEERVRECDHVVRVPTRFCMNLAAAVNVVLYDRVAKRGAPWLSGGDPLRADPRAVMFVGES